MLSLIRDFWRRQLSTPSAISVDEIRTAVRDLSDARAKDIAKRYARGNVRIQGGAYMTADEVDSVLGKAPWRH